MAAFAVPSPIPTPTSLPFAVEAPLSLRVAWNERKALNRPWIVWNPKANAVIFGETNMTNGETKSRGPYFQRSGSTLFAHIYGPPWDFDTTRGIQWSPVSQQWADVTDSSHEQFLQWIMSHLQSKYLPLLNVRSDQDAKTLAETAGCPQHDCLEVDPKRCSLDTFRAPLLDSYVYASPRFRELVREAGNATTAEQRADYEIKAKPFKRCEPWLEIPVGSMSERDLDNLVDRETFERNPDVKRLRETMQLRNAVIASAREIKSLSSIEVSVPPTRDEILALSANGIFLRNLLQSEATLLQWKQQQYERKSAEVARNIQRLSQQIQRYKAQDMPPAGYQSDQDALNAYHRRAVALQDLAASCRSRRNDITAHWMDPTSGLLIHKARQLREVVDFVESMQGDERKTFREAVYSRIVIFARSASLFIGSYINNFVLMGGAGVGKSTAADILANSLYRIGLLLTPNIYARKESDLIGQYVGQTAPRMRAALEQALEGVLFIDEAYTISGCPDPRTGQYSKDYGKEAMDTMVDFMSENAGLISIIVAGYPDKMVRCFLAVNEGLPRRFTSKVMMPNYSAKDLFSILNKQIVARSEGQLSLAKMFDPAIVQYLGDIIRTTYENPFTSWLFAYQAGDMQNLADFLLEHFWLHVSDPRQLPLNRRVAQQVVDAAFHVFRTDKELIADLIPQIIESSAPVSTVPSAVLSTPTPASAPLAMEFAPTQVPSRLPTGEPSRKRARESDFLV